jgi:hypothetical protein
MRLPVPFNAYDPYVPQPSRLYHDILQFLIQLRRHIKHLFQLFPLSRNRDHLIFLDDSIKFSAHGLDGFETLCWSVCGETPDIELEADFCFSEQRNLLDEGVIMCDHASSSPDGLFCLFQNAIWGVIGVGHNDGLLWDHDAERNCAERKNREKNLHCCGDFLKSGMLY